MPEAIPTFSTEIPLAKPALQTTTIRLASVADAPQISALGMKVFTTSFGYSLPPSDLADYLSSSYNMSAISKDILNPLMTTFVACPVSDPDLVLGFTQLTRGSTEPCVESCPNPVELQRLYVSTETHGLGLGRKLVNAVEERAREEGFQTLWLGVWEENLKAHGFYGKVGLEKCGEHDFVMGTCVQRDWILKKAL